MSLLSISRRVFVGACGSAAAWVLSGGRAVFAPATGAEPAKRPRPKITISKETTYIERPLRPDGYPDYLAAVNELGRKGVTAENNAVIPFWQAVGPKEIPPEVREAYFALLGVPVPPEQGAYLVPLADFLRRYRGGKNADGDTPEDGAWLSKVYDQFDKAQSRPWSKKQYPAIAALLDANAEPLDQLVTATRRSRWWSPRVAKEGGSLFRSELIIGLDPARETTRELLARAMLRLQSGQTDAAWQDVLGCHCLGRFYARGPLAVDQLVGRHFDNMASRAGVTFAQRAGLTAERARRCQADLRALPPAPPMRETLDQDERMYLLDGVLAVAVDGPKALQIEVGGQKFYPPSILGGDKTEWETYERLASDPRIDWDEVMRQYNRRIDQIVAAYDRASYAEREQAMGPLEKEDGKRAAEVVQQMPMLRSLSAAEASKTIARWLFEIHLSSWLPAEQAMIIAEAHAETFRHLEQLAFALAAYRHEQGAYPPRLGDLAPRYIPAVPKDPFTDRALVYKPQKDGYLVYSVGPNQRDDDGRSHLDPEEKEKYENETDSEKLPDDIAIRTPTRR